jgi:nicotinamide mononucleotide (NMN) deamidase PncC
LQEQQQEQYGFADASWRKSVSYERVGKCRRLGRPVNENVLAAAGAVKRPAAAAAASYARERMAAAQAISSKLL